MSAARDFSAAVAIATLALIIFFGGAIWGYAFEPRADKAATVVACFDKCNAKGMTFDHAWPTCTCKEAR